MDPKYQQIAEKVENLIGVGTFRAGDRLPSVRAISRDWRVSVTTAVGAYSLLEYKGVVEARNRSGYFVRPRIITADRLPRSRPPKGSPVDVSCAGITEYVMDAASSTDVIPFGAAVPSDDILPTSKLLSLYHSVARSKSASAFQYSALADAFHNHPVNACILQPNFHNPMGSVIPRDRKKRIVQLAEEHGVTIIEDDLYGDLYFGPTRPPALKAFDSGDVVIHCGSYSKALAPGLRVGWILPGSRFHRVKNLKYATSIANNTISEMVVAEFLKAGGVDRHLRRTRQIFARQTLQIREAILREFPAGTRVSSPEGGFVLWCEMQDGFDSEKFSVAALKRKISVVPGTLFSATCGLRNCFRISCGFPLDDRAHRGIGILARLAASQL